MSEIHYQKKYPPDNCSFTGTGRETEQEPPFVQKLRDRLINEHGRSIPGRDQQKQDFIERAIHCSERYELDCQITEERSHIAALFAFDCGMGLHELKNLIHSADEILFLPGGERQIRLVLYYYLTWQQGNPNILSL